MYEIDATTVFVSFVITWLIGLIPPSLIRYAILKRPIAMWPAIGICALFWLINIFLFTAMRSKSKTHGALVLIAFVSFYILRKKPAAKNKSEKSKNKQPAQQPTQTKRALTFCPECGKEISTESRFCNWCGVFVPQMVSDKSHLQQSLGHDHQDSILPAREEVPDVILEDLGPLNTKKIDEKEQEGRTSKQEEPLSSLSEGCIQETKVVRDHKHDNFISLTIGILLAALFVGYLITEYKPAPQVSPLDTYRLAAEQGDAGAQSKLGFMYYRGDGVAQDHIEAAKWFHLAAAQGDVYAQSSLGFMYYRGDGVAQDYKEAEKWYIMAAAQGHAGAQSSLGYMYERGNVIPQDSEEALKWYRLAAAQGDAFAQSSLGYMYYEGDGVTKDFIEALKWFHLAAAQGDADAQFILGYMYSRGEGVDKDYEEAEKWYLMAAAQGDIYAQSSLGYMYSRGEGVDKDYEEAEKWFRLAAAQGDADAQFGLGAMYYAGVRVSEDYVQAYKWFDLSAAQGFKKAIKLRDLLKNKMSPSQIAEAQRLSSKFHPKKQ